MSVPNQSKMSFETAKRVLFLCVISLSFYVAVTGSEPPHRKLPRNETVGRVKPIVHPTHKRLPEPRIDLAPPTASLIQTVLNAAGVCGLGFLWIKEITGALGTPILAPFLMPPLLLLTGFLIFLPQLREIFGMVFNN